MATYRIEITRTAEKRLKTLPKRDRKRVVDAILRLGEDPHPRGSRKLTGYDDVFRIRVGLYRVIYSVLESDVVVIILKLGHRKDVYR